MKSTKGKNFSLFGALFVFGRKKQRIISITLSIVSPVEHLNDESIRDTYREQTLKNLRDAARDFSETGGGGATMGTGG